MCANVTIPVNVIFGIKLAVYRAALGKYRREFVTEAPVFYEHDEWI